MTRARGVLTSSDGLLDVVIHAQSSPGMEIASQLEGIGHGEAVGHVGQDAQLQLPIVSHHKSVPLRHVGCESFAHLQRATSCRLVRAGARGGGGGEVGENERSWGRPRGVYVCV